MGDEWRPSNIIMHTAPSYWRHAGKRIVSDSTSVSAIGHSKSATCHVSYMTETAAICYRIFETMHCSLNPPGS